MLREETEGKILEGLVPSGPLGSRPINQGFSNAFYLDQYARFYEP